MERQAAKARYTELAAAKKTKKILRNYGLIIADISGASKSKNRKAAEMDWREGAIISRIFANPNG